MSPELSGRIRGWIEEAKARHPETLIRGGDAIMLYGEIGGAAYLRPDGVILTAAWDDDGKSKVETDPGRHLDETGERP